MKWPYLGEIYRCTKNCQVPVGNREISVNPLDLISPRERNELKSLFFSFKHHSIKSMSIPMSHVKCDFQAPYLIEKEQRPLNQLRSIIIDENNQLIANEKTYFLYKIQYKKTIPVWKLSLLDLQNRKYALGDFLKILREEKR